jgi:uncharacterized membrane protein YedE/YeeE
MSVAFIAVLVLVSLFSIAFTVRRYRTATPTQQRQILLGVIGAVIVALGMGAFVFLR